MALHQHRTQDYRDQRRERLGPAQQRAGQEGEAGSERRGRQQRQPAPPGQVIDRRRDGSAGYFVRDPGRAGERMPERVVHRQGRMGEHPAARSDVQIGVGVVERRHRLSERPNEGGEPGDQRPRRDEPA